MLQAFGGIAVGVEELNIAQGIFYTFQRLYVQLGIREIVLPAGSLFFHGKNKFTEYLRFEGRVTAPPGLPSIIRVARHLLC